MGTITKRRRRDGTLSYRAEIRIKRQGRIVHRESETFSKQAMAKKWMQRRELELQEPGALDTVLHDGITVRQAIDEYVERYRPMLEWGRNKDRTLRFLQNGPLADLDAVRLTKQQILEYVTERRKTAKPQTVFNDLIYLKGAFQALRGHGVPVALAELEDAMLHCRRHRMVTSKSGSRERRPTKEELFWLTWKFSRQRKTQIPMRDIMWFAVYSGRRRGEITRLRWDDNDPDTMTGMVRDAKHPRHKQGNHQRFKYTPEAWEIIERQPRESEFIFPFNSSSIGARFERACKSLGIEDLHFHDLRHEATSRLFEAGYSIIEVQRFTLHEDWNVLRRYTHLRPEDIVHR